MKFLEELFNHEIESATLYKSPVKVESGFDIYMSDSRTIHIPLTYKFPLTYNILRIDFKHKSPQSNYGTIIRNVMWLELDIFPKRLAEWLGYTAEELRRPVIQWKIRKKIDDAIERLKKISYFSEAYSDSLIKPTKVRTIPELLAILAIDVMSPNSQ